MKSNSSPPELAPHSYHPSTRHFSPTTVESFVCPHRFYRERIWLPSLTPVRSDNSEPEPPEKPSLHFGTAMHAAVAAYYSTMGDTLSNRKAAALTAALDSWGRDYPHNPYQKQNIYTLIHLVNEYCEAYIRDVATFLPDTIEATAWVDMPNGTRLGTQMDRVEVASSGMLYLYDTKTSGQNLTPYWWKQWENSLQMSLYWYVLEQTYGVCHQLTIDAISLQPGPTPLARHGYFRTAAQIAAAVNTYLRITDTILAGLDLPTEEQELYFYQQPKECTAYGGCPFLEFCTHGYDTPRAMIHFNLTQEH